MPSQKRERKRAGREARREAAREAQRRAARRRQLTGAGVLVLVIALIGFLVSRGGDDEQDVAAGDASTTTTTAKGVDETKADCPPPDGAAEPRKSFDGQPKMCINVTKTYTARVETDLGPFTMELDAKAAPLTVNNFVWLARYKAYDGAPFHRVIPGFVVQGGDVEKGDGTGGPGYDFPDELPEKGRYQLGSVAMANSGPDTNGSQFFVITGPQGVALPPNYSLFGKVTSGFEEVVKKIESDGSEAGTPKVVHKIVRVTITES